MANFRARVVSFRVVVPPPLQHTLTLAVECLLTSSLPDEEKLVPLRSFAKESPDVADAATRPNEPEAGTATKLAKGLVEHGRLDIEDFPDTSSFERDSLVEILAEMGVSSGQGVTASFLNAREPEDAERFGRSPKGYPHPFRMDREASLPEADVNFTGSVPALGFVRVSDRLVIGEKNWLT